MPTEMITDEMRAAGVDETTILKTREEMVAEIGEEAVKKIEEEAIAEQPAETPVTPEIAPVEEVAEEAEEIIKTELEPVTERPVPFVKGRHFRAKELVEAYWNGDRLCVKDVEGTTYTLSGEELSEFLY